MAYEKIDAWRSGSSGLVVESGAELLHCCLKCDQPVAKTYNRKLMWHPSWLYILILMGLLVYVIVAMIVRQTCTVRVGLCATHARRRRIFMVVGWVAFLSSLALFFAAATVDGRRSGMPDLGMILGFSGLALLLFAAFWSVYVGSLLVTPSSINGRRAWLNGAGAPLLSQLPEYTGSRG